MRTGGLGEIMVSFRDGFAVDPARKGFAPDGTAANLLPLGLLPIVPSR